MGNLKNRKYDKKYPEMLVQHMSKGFSFSTFGAVVNVTRATLHNWCNNYPEFAEAKELGNEKAKEFFESALLTKLAGIEFSDSVDLKNSELTAIIFALKTRFHKEYGDKIKQEMTITDFNFVGDDD